jgi:Tfp pilus assembly protein PilF
MTRIWQMLPLGLTALIATGCGTSRHFASPLECADPDHRLAEAVASFSAAKADGCPSSGIAGSSACADQRLTSALLAYDDGNPARAQQLLDEVLSRPGSYPAAAVLRARIAIDDGNLPFARRFLQQQIRLAPDNGALREAYGAALYLDGALDTAKEELMMAQRLGAPQWRVAYHLGMVAEAENRLDEARQRYREAVEGNPSWAPARARLNALDQRLPTAK